MEAADNIEESAEDITAADRAPSPRKVIAGGQRYCKVIGKISGRSLSGIGTGPSQSVLFQSVDAATAPRSAAGVAMTIQPTAAM
uniref:Uncharacterized protein n=1 Tax=Arion vulgaris TaxID=1028688 RepID=A0A0B7AHJ7_9EUPU